MPTDTPTPTPPRPKQPRRANHEELKKRATPFGAYLLDAIDGSHLNIKLFCTLMSERTLHRWYPSRLYPTILHPTFAKRKARQLSDDDLYAMAGVLGITPIEVFTHYYGVEKRIQVQFSYLWDMLTHMPEREWADVVTLVEGKAKRLGISGPPLHKETARAE